MDCNDVQDYVGDAIDRFLPQRVEKEFSAHLGVCCKCRTAYELERLAKHVVQRSMEYVNTPRSVQTLVLQSLREHSPGSATSTPKWIRRLFAR